MSYLPQRFPVSIASGPTGGPNWSTEVITLSSGDESRNQNWLSSRHSYEVSHGVKSESQFRAIGAHFRMARGKVHHFRFKDFADFELERQDGLLAELSATTFQIYKTYGDLVDFQETRKITRPVDGTVAIWKDGVAQALISNFTFDVETGVVTFNIAPGASMIEVACQFDVPVRYDTDKLESVLVRYSQQGDSFISWASVPLIEHRE